MSKNILDNPIVLGVVGAPHGVKGHVRVKSYTEDPLALADYGVLDDGFGNRFEVSSIRPAKNVVVVKFKGVDGRFAAEALKGVELFVERSQLPDEELDDDEFYIEDLIGLDVLNEAGTLIGVVSAVQNFGAGDIIEVAQLDKAGKVTKKVDVYPFTRTVVPEIDFEREVLTLVPSGEIVVAPEGSKEREADPDHVSDEDAS